MEAAWNEQFKTYVHANNHIIKAFRGEKTLKKRNDRLSLM